MWKNKLSKEAIKQFDACKTKEDYIEWHKVNTPWFDNKSIERIADIYINNTTEVATPKPEETTKGVIEESKEENL